MSVIPRELSFRPSPAALIESADNSTVAPPERSDHNLMLAVRNGEIERLGDLFERHHRPLFGFLARLTGDATASEDLVQLVFFRILKYRHTYRAEGKFSAWLYHLARKVAADHFRKQARTGTTASPEMLQHHADHAPTAAEHAASRDDVALMRVALSQLPLDQREVLTLHRFQHLRHDEIARLHDCSVGAVKVRVHRALAALRERYLKLHQQRPA